MTVEAGAILRDKLDRREYGTRRPRRLFVEITVTHGPTERFFRPLDRVAPE